MSHRDFMQSLVCITGTRTADEAAMVLLYLAGLTPRR